MLDHFSPLMELILECANHLFFGVAGALISLNASPSGMKLDLELRQVISVGLTAHFQQELTPT